jgi:fatty-acyl-CoA synthase
VERRVSTVGQVLPHVEIKIVDAEGKAVMKGYWNDPDKTKDAIDEAGWMRTGDLATMDPRVSARARSPITRSRAISSSCPSSR